MGILNSNTISKFLKTKTQTQKDPLELNKNKYIYIWRPQITKFYGRNPSISRILIQDLKFSRKQKNQIKKGPYRISIHGISGQSTH